MRKLASSIFTFGLILILLGLCTQYKSTIIDFYNAFLSPHDKIKIEEKNIYYRGYNYIYVQNTNTFNPTNYQDILNIFYSVLNSGADTFSFYCPREYENCIEDIKKLANDQDALSDINNYVHPFNGFTHIETEYDTLRKITIRIDHSYTQEQIDAINTKVDELYQLLYNPNEPTINNIKTIHDYIINTTKYDVERTNTGNSQYNSETAYGPLFEGYAVCGGYTDLMQLFLERMNLNSFRVSSEKHVWNAVYYDEEWLNLDLTWDDPVVSDGSDYLEYSYFMISTDELLYKEKTEHNFNLDHYKELE